MQKQMYDVNSAWLDHTVKLKTIWTLKGQCHKINFCGEIFDESDPGIKPVLLYGKIAFDTFTVTFERTKKVAFGTHFHK